MRSGSPRALVVTHYWMPHLGGIEVLARDQAHRLAEMGWDVTVLTSRLGTDRSRLADGPVTVRRFSCSNVLESRLNVPVPVMSPTMLAALLRSAGDFDVVVAHGHVYLGSCYAALAAGRTRTPLVVIQHSPFVQYGLPTLNAVERAADRTAGRWVLQRADQVVAVSDFTGEFVRDIAPRARVATIHPGVDLERFHPGETMTGTRDRPLFVTVRRLVPRMGVEVLIKAWIDEGLGRHADLAVVGDGALREDLTRMARHDRSISFVGRLSDEELPGFYRSADAFVLPTVSGEGYGLALAEALASGLPAIVTDDGGPKELIDPDHNGILVPPGDVVALGRALREMATDRALRDRLSSNARAGRGLLDRAASVLRLSDVLRDVVERRARSSRQAVQS